jgi:hypothetical protein
MLSRRSAGDGLLTRIAKVAPRRARDSCNEIPVPTLRTCFAGITPFSFNKVTVLLVFDDARTGWRQRYFSTTKTFFSIIQAVTLLAAARWTADRRSAIPSLLLAYVGLLWVIFASATAQAQTRLSETTWGGNGSDVSDGVATARRLEQKRRCLMPQYLLRRRLLSQLFRLR